jgi:hypothetical protein
MNISVMNSLRSLWTRNKIILLALAITGLAVARPRVFNTRDCKQDYPTGPGCNECEAHQGVVTVFSALHKSGSMWVHENTQDLCFLSKRDIISENPCSGEQLCRSSFTPMFTRLPENALNDPVNVLLGIPRNASTCVGPVRNVFSWRDNVNRCIVHVFVLRNPLDVLVSQFFSFGWTHLNPTTGINEGVDPNIHNQSADEFVISAAPELRNAFDTLLITINSCCDPKSHGCFYRCVFASYEESMTSYATWVDKLAGAVFTDPIARQRAASIMRQKHEDVPKTILQGVQENNSSHVRSGVPGNYALHLSPDVAESLRVQFSDILELMNAWAENIEVAGLYHLPERTTWLA